MSVDTSPIGVSLTDLLTRIIPGFYVLSPFIVALYIEQKSIFDQVEITVLAIFITSLLVGEIVDQIRNATVTAPRDFQRYIAATSDQPSRNPFFDKYLPPIRDYLTSIVEIFTGLDRKPVNQRLNMDFQEDIENRLGVNFQEDSTEDIYDLFERHLEPHLGQRTRRHRAIYTMSANIKMAIITSVFLYSAGLLAETGPEASRITAYAFIFSFVSAFAWWGTIRILELAQLSYLESLFKEYYLLHHDDNL